MPGKKLLYSHASCLEHSLNHPSLLPSSGTATGSAAWAEFFHYNDRKHPSCLMYSLYLRISLCSGKRRTSGVEPRYFVLMTHVGLGQGEQVQPDSAEAQLARSSAKHETGCTLRQHCYRLGSSCSQASSASVSSGGDARIWGRPMDRRTGVLPASGKHASLASTAIKWACIRGMRPPPHGPPLLIHPAPDIAGKCVHLPSCVRSEVPSRSSWRRPWSVHACRPEPCSLTQVCLAGLYGGDPCCPYEAMGWWSPSRWWRLRLVESHTSIGTCPVCSLLRVR
jgi:hypothetical protein